MSILRYGQTKARHDNPTVWQQTIVHASATLPKSSCIISTLQPIFAERRGKEINPCNRNLLSVCGLHSWKEDCARRRSMDGNNNGYQLLVWILGNYLTRQP